MQSSQTGFYRVNSTNKKCFPPFSENPFIRLKWKMEGIKQERERERVWSI